MAKRKAPSILTCRHGKPVKVVIETASPICWDDGIITYTRDGVTVRSLPWDERPKTEYLTVEGCNICGLIEVREE
jgi:hypothetical protein